MGADRPDPDQQNKALEWLAGATVINEKRADVAEVLEQEVNNNNPATHDSAAKALAQWAGPEDMLTLIRAGQQRRPMDPSRSGRRGLRPPWSA